MTTNRDRVTLVLTEVEESTDPDRVLFDRLVPLVYDELRRMARAQLAGDRARSVLDTTGLVHEAYLKLVDADRLPVRSRSYFFGAAARAMRQVLVDAARRRKRKKRGGDPRPITLDESTLAVDALAEELVAVDEALENLSATHSRAARVLECRYFGGLTVDETAETLQIAQRTVARDTTFALTWLRREMDREAPESSHL